MNVFVVTSLSEIDDEPVVLDEISKVVGVVKSREECTDLIKKQINNIKKETEVDYVEQYERVEMCYDKDQDLVCEIHSCVDLDVYVDFSNGSGYDVYFKVEQIEM